MACASSPLVPVVARDQGRLSSCGLAECTGSPSLHLHSQVWSDKAALPAAAPHSVRGQ